MCVAVNCQMQLTPDTAAFLTMLFDFPLAFTEDLQPGGINYRCAISPRVGVLKLILTDFARLLTQL
ncbi:hypothetical protein VEE68_46960 [Escherichia coli]|nr:hypothetical protein VEE68_46960 [Escherichia coli]